MVRTIGSYFTLSSGKIVRMAPSRGDQDELHRAIVSGTDPAATARAFELLLDPLKIRLRFRWPTMSQDELESWAIDALIAYLENPARYDPKQSALLTYLVMDADGSDQHWQSTSLAGRDDACQHRRRAHAFIVVGDEHHLEIVQPRQYVPRKFGLHCLR